MKKLIYILFALTSFSSFADCFYQMRINNAAIVVTDNSQVIQQMVYLERWNPSNTNCRDYRIFFSKGLAYNYQRKAFTLWGLPLNYNLHKSSNQSGILKERNDALNSNEYLEGNMAERNRLYTDSFFISVPGHSNTTMKSGYYYDVVQASMYSLTNGSLDFERAENFSLVFYINQNVHVSIIDEGGNFDSGSTSKVLDFGYLTQNAEKGADVRVLSNGSYQLKISSQNNGTLKLNEASRIAYSLRVNGSPVNLSSSSGTPVEIGSGEATSNAGDLYNLKVKITEDTQNKAAGLYQDIITITAIAN